MNLIVSAADGQRRTLEQSGENDIGQGYEFSCIRCVRSTSCNRLRRAAIV